MSPWTVIGWIIVVALLSPVIIGISTGMLSLYLYVSKSVKNYFAYLKTRNILPETGQAWYWSKRGLYVFIQDIFPDGMVLVRVGTATWSESITKWRQRVRTCRLSLQRTRNGLLV